MAILSYILSVCSDISEKNVVIYSYQEQYVAHAYKIVFGKVIVANVSDILCICCKKWANFIHIWYSNQASDIFKIALGFKPNLSNYGNMFLKFYVCCDISEKNGLVLFIFYTVIHYPKDLMHIKYTLAKC